MIARSSLAADLTDVASWWAYVARYEARETWRAIPGPWWVKVPVFVLVVAEPGPFGEMALFGILAACRWVKRRMDARKAVTAH